MCRRGTLVASSSKQFAECAAQVTSQLMRQAVRDPLTVPIRVGHPGRLRGWLIEAERVPVGLAEREVIVGILLRFTGVRQGSNRAKGVGVVAVRRTATSLSEIHVQSGRVVRRNEGVTAIVLGHHVPTVKRILGRAPAGHASFGSARQRTIRIAHRIGPIRVTGKPVLDGVGGGRQAPNTRQLRSASSQSPRVTRMCGPAIETSHHRFLRDRPFPVAAKAFQDDVRYVISRQNNGSGSIPGNR